MSPFIASLYYYVLDNDYMKGEDDLAKVMFHATVAILGIQNLFQLVLYFSGRMSIKKDLSQNKRYITVQTIIFWLTYIVVPVICTVLCVVILLTTDVPEMRVMALFLLVAVLGNGVWIFVEIRGSFFGGMVPVWQDEAATFDVVGRRMDKCGIARKVKLTDDEYK